MLRPSLPFIVPEAHPDDVVTEIVKLFPAFEWRRVIFDDDDTDYMLVVAACGSQVEVRTGHPLVVRT